MDCKINTEITNVKVVNNDYKTSVIKDFSNATEVMSTERKTTKSSVGKFLKSMSESLSAVPTNTVKNASNINSQQNNAKKTSGL